MEEFEKQLQALHDLARSSGWKLFAEELGRIARQAQQSMKLENDPVALSRQVTLASVASELSTWPERSYQILLHQLQMLQSEQK